MDPRTGFTRKVYDANQENMIDMSKSNVVCREKGVYVIAREIAKPDQNTDEAGSSTVNQLIRLRTDGSGGHEKVMALPPDVNRFIMDARGERIAFMDGDHLVMRSLSGEELAKVRAPGVYRNNPLMFRPGNQEILFYLDDPGKSSYGPDIVQGYYLLPLKDGALRQMYAFDDLYEVNASGDQLYLTEIHVADNFLIKRPDGSIKYGPMNTPRKSNDISSWRFATLDPSGRYVAAIDRFFDVWITDMQTRRKRRTHPNVRDVDRICWGAQLPALPDIETSESSRLNATVSSVNGQIPGRLPEGDTLLSLPGSIRKVVFHPVSGKLVTLGEHGQILIWNKGEPRPAEKLQIEGYLPRTHRPERISLAQDGKLLIMHHPSRIQIVEMDTGKSKEIAMYGKRVVATNSARDLLAIGVDRKVTLYVFGGREGGQTEFSTCKIGAMELSQNGEILAVACIEGGVELYEFKRPDLNSSVDPQSDVPSGSEPVVVGKPRRISAIPERLEDMAFSPNGSLLAVQACERITLWNVASGQPAGELEGHPMCISAMAFSPDGKHLASAGMEGFIRIWDLKLKKEIDRIDPGLGQMRTLAFSPDGKQLVVGSMDDGLVSFWDRGTRRFVGSHFADPRPFYGLTFDSERKVLMVLDMDSREHVLTIPDGRPLYVDKGGKILAMTMPPGSHLLSVFTTMNTWHWDLKSGEHFSAETDQDADGREVPEPVKRAATEARERYCALLKKRESGDNVPSASRLYGDRFGVLGDFSLYRGMNTSSVLFPDPAQFMNLQWSSSPKACTGMERFLPKNQLLEKGVPEFGVLNADGSVYGALNSRRQVELWKVSNWEKTHTISQRAVTVFAFDPTGKWVAAGSMDVGRVVVHEVATGAQVSKFASPNVQSLAFSKDGRYLLVGGAKNGVISIHDPVTGVSVRERKVGIDAVEALRFSEDFRLLVVLEAGGWIRLIPWKS